MDLGEEIFHITNKFPRKEERNLSSQTMRAVDSIALNIAEGSIAQSTPELKKFLGYSIRSLAEVVTCLVKARRREYINDKVFQANYKYSYNLMNMLISFRRNAK